ncbi:hypothetical protein [Exiguobacterium acetylicum]|uniref:DUF5671 domain-containing protein n=1 Tax=Exiguobacterium acetylicum TaxID=41170 RepID=A0ABX8GF19_EXIAC|nr:hypothetical protein [Exiguobacterium acetylicum]QWB31978.1 hypothetical protein KKI46_17615 [Exiguobacterium acetylicum]
MNRPPRAERHSSTMTLAEYRAELKEKTGFLISLGGAVIAFCFYNLAVRQQIEIETYGHTTKLFNQDFIMQGIIDFKLYIDLFMFSIPIFLSLHTFLSPKSAIVYVIETKCLTFIIYPLFMGVCILAVLAAEWYYNSMWGGRESNFGAKGMVWVFIATNIMCLINLFMRKDDGGVDHVKYDVKVMTPVAISFVLLIGVSIPYVISLESIRNNREIDFVQYANKSYYLVEKDKEKLLLREVERPTRKKVNGDFVIEDYFVPTSRYKVVNTTDVVIKNEEMLEPIGNKLTKIEFKNVYP